MYMESLILLDFDYIWYQLRLSDKNIIIILNV